jgi:hypothetical protein
MTIIVILVFLGVFGVVVLIAAASGSGATEQTRAIMTRLESAIAVGKPEMADLVIDVRKNELVILPSWNSPRVFGVSCIRPTLNGRWAPSVSFAESALSYRPTSFTTAPMRCCSDL